MGRCGVSEIQCLDAPPFERQINTLRCHPAIFTRSPTSAPIQVTVDVRACYMTMYKLAMQIHQTCSFPRKELKVHIDLRKQKGGMIRRAIRRVGTKDKDSLKSLLDSANEMQLNAPSKRYQAREQGTVIDGALAKIDTEIAMTKHKVRRKWRRFWLILCSRKHLQLWLTDQLLAWEDLLTEADNNFVSYVQQTQSSTRWRDKLWLALEVPSSSFAARAFNQLLLFMIVVSVGVFIAESVPFFYPHSEHSDLCQLITQK